MKKTKESAIGAMPNLAALDAIVSGRNDNQASAAPAVAVPKPTTAQEPTVIMTTRLPVSFHKRLKRHTVDTGESLQDFTMRALEAMLSAEEQS